MTSLIYTACSQNHSHSHSHSQFYSHFYSLCTRIPIHFCVIKSSPSLLSYSIILALSCNGLFISFVSFISSIHVLFKELAVIPSPTSPGPITLVAALRINFSLQCLRLRRLNISDFWLTSGSLQEPSPLDPVWFSLLLGTWYLLSSLLLSSQTSPSSTTLYAPGWYLPPSSFMNSVAVGLLLYVFLWYISCYAPSNS